MDGGRRSGSQVAGRPVWARVAGGRRAQVRVTFRPPPFPHPYLDDDATYSAHNLGTSYSKPLGSHHQNVSEF